MGQSRWLYFPAPVGLNAAVLYSVENGNNREFWVVTPSYTVKVLEIPIEVTESPSISIGNAVGDSATVSGSATNGDGGSFGSISGTLPPGTSVSFDISTTAVYTSGTGFVTARSSLTTSGQSSAGKNSAGTIFSSGSGSGSTLLFAAGSGSGVVVSQPALNVLASGSVSGDASVTHTITSISSRITPIDYDAWISATATEVFVTVRHELDTDWQHLDLVTIDSQGIVSSSTSYQIGDTVATRSANWRNNFEDFTPISGQPANSDPCYDLYENSADVNAQSNTLFYSVNRSQLVSGITLEAYLEGTAGSINVESDKITTINSGGSCSTDSTDSISIKLESRGSDTVEGIAVIPAA